MMDVSDGLLLDSWRMAQASGVTFALDPNAIPVADPLRLADCIRWGDDYELLFTVPPDAALPAGTYRIGKVMPAGETPLMLDGTAQHHGDRLGYMHG